MSRVTRPLALLAAACVVAGCERPVKEQTVEVKGIDPMTQVQSTLQNYARGQPLASEVMGFDALVAEVRKVNPGKAEILKDGLDDLKKSKGSPAAKAKALLKKLGLDEATAKR